MTLLAFSFTADLEAGLQWVYNWFVTQMSAYGHSEVATLWAGFSAVFPSVDISGCQATFNQMDYFFPLSELIGFVSAYLTLYSAVYLYKLGKSWFFGS